MRSRFKGLGVAVVLLAFVCPLMAGFLRAQSITIEDPYFSYARFYGQLEILTVLAEDGRMRPNIRSFARNFAEGIYAISADDLARAKTRLLRARAIWPEYFATDFLLARVIEDAGDYALSARFYKSYLDKLRSLYEGRYRISASLIRSITPYRIESYEEAEAAVRERLRRHGIDLDGVRPFVTVPKAVWYLVALLVIGTGYFIIAYRIVPYVKQRRFVKHPPPGTWVCERCGTVNVTMRFACETCHAPRPS